MTEYIETTNKERTQINTFGSLVHASLLAILAATVANLGLYYAAGVLFPEVIAWAGSGPGQIAGANFVYLSIGAILFAVITRISSNPRRHYLILATIALVLSLGLPISAGFGYGPTGTVPAGAATVVTLCLMHAVSYAISLPLFIRTLSD